MPASIPPPENDRPLHSRRAFLGAALVAPVALAAACSDDGGTDSAGVIKLGEDDLAPPVDDVQDDTAAGSEVDIDYTTFDGSAANFTAFGGKPLVINFFASWCPPCVAEMPEFEEVFQEYGGDVSFVGLSQDVALADAEAIVDQTGVTYELGWDPDGDVFSQFGGIAMPTTVFVDSAGIVRTVFAGALTRDALVERIEELA